MNNLWVKSVILGCKEIAYEIIFSSLTWRQKAKRILFRSQFLRRLKRHRIKKRCGIRYSEITPTELSENGFASLHLNLDEKFLQKMQNLDYHDNNSGQSVKGTDILNVTDAMCYGRFVAVGLDIMESDIKSLVNNEILMDHVNSYLGRNALISDISSWITTPTHLPLDHHEFGFHMDLGDTGGWKWLNVFIYLSDVDLSNGPHRAIKSTHYRRHWSSIWERRLSKERAEKIYAPDRFFTFEGPAGTVVIEDTGNYHAASKVHIGSASRHILQVVFRAE